MSESNFPSLDQSLPVCLHPARPRRWIYWPLGLAIAFVLSWSVNCGPVVAPGESKSEIHNTERDAASTLGDTPPEDTSPVDTPLADVPGVDETPNTPDSPEVPETPDAPDASGVPDVPEPSDTPDPTDAPDTPDAAAQVKPRLLALDKDGKMASLQLTTPWTVLSTGDLKRPTASARCFGGRCLVVHPSPADSISVVDPVDLSKFTLITLARGADPRDVAFVDADTVVVSQHGKAALLLLNLNTGVKESIALGALADADGVPEALRMAHCGRRVFVQLLRVDQTTGAPSSMGAAIAVIDIPLQGAPRIVDTDPSTPGVQPIKLTGQPKFDMPVDCASGILYIGEPKPLMKGGGWYEQVDLKTLQASEFPIDNGAEVGGFAVVGPKLYWFITHTATGPAGNSSHLNLVGGPKVGTYNTFADQKLDELALDQQLDLLFFPDNCVKSASYPLCASGVHVFHSRTGAALPKGVIPLGFAPMELAISR